MNEKLQSTISVAEQTSRAFNDSSEDQIINNAQKLIKLPFPPMVDPCDLIVLRPDGHVPRAPNAFIIYRKLFVKVAYAYKYNLPMSVISSIASKSWEQESDDVKEEYRRIAKEAFNYRNTLFPELKSGSKRNRWKAILFNKPYTRKIRMPKSMKTVNKSMKRKKKLESPTSSTSVEIGSLKETISPDLNLNYFTDWTNQDIYQKPDLSIIYNGPHENFENYPENSCSMQSFNLLIQGGQLNLSQIDNIADDNQPFNQISVYDTQYELGVSAFPEFGLIDFQNINSSDIYHEISHERQIFTNLLDSTQHDISENTLTYEMDSDYYY